MRTIQLCCCQTRLLSGHRNCEKHDVTGSSHTCSVTGKLVSGWCLLVEGYGSSAPCTGCRTLSAENAAENVKYATRSKG